MNAAFIVMLDTGADSDLPGIARELTEDLLEKGYNVKYVNPWSRKVDKETLAALAVQMQTATPSQQQNQQP